MSGSIHTGMPAAKIRMYNNLEEMMGKKKEEDTVTEFKVTGESLQSAKLFAEFHGNTIAPGELIEGILERLLVGPESDFQVDDIVEYVPEGLDGADGSGSIGVFLGEENSGAHFKVLKGRGWLSERREGTTCFNNLKLLHRPGQK